jgi:hypothetical protein
MPKHGWEIEEGGRQAMKLLVSIATVAATALALALPAGADVGRAADVGHPGDYFNGTKWASRAHASSWNGRIMSNTWSSVGILGSTWSRAES